MLRPIRLIIPALLTLGAANSAVAQPAPLSPRNANYTLRATLTPATRTLEGRGRLTWRNTAAVPATELRFHLYWNAWRDAHSTWFKEQRLGSHQRFSERPADDAGWMDMTALTLVDGEARHSLLSRAHYVAPDDGNERDRTVLAVPLDAAVPPGDTIELDLSWTARVPRTVARTGVLGRYYFIAQWFPKIGVFEDTGWNCHQFHMTTEFFADFGVYDVSLTVPTGWVVGATGVERGRQTGPDGTTTHRYVQADVHDFAWTTSPDFLEVTRRVADAGARPVDVRLLLQPAHAGQIDRHVSAIRATLASYARWVGPYPYEQLTVVDPIAIVNARAQGNDTGGMEYPTLITAGTHWIAPWQGSDPEGVTIHEAGHQFWYGIVATNEFEHAWMDEGLTTYMTARVITEAFPSRFTSVERYFGGLVAWPFVDVPWSRNVDGNRLRAYRSGTNWDPPSAPTWAYWPGTARSVTYAKTALWLTTLERMIGWDRTQRVLTTYFARYAFRHPVPRDFFAVASEVSGQDLTWFFDAVYRSAATFDYAVAQVTTEPESGGLTRSVVVVRRLGDGVFPVDIRFTFEDGSTTVERWDGMARWHAIPQVHIGGLRKVEIDPDRVLTLDVSYTNNSWTAEPRAAEAASSWALRWLTWVQSTLLTYAFFI